ncbi:MAG: sulfate ABC transporter permease subunit CysT [Cyanobacteria bacterium]|nr:sulfate ABC transporter permease subunit CysT [Cyanobacteriota bacterium]
MANSNQGVGGTGTAAVRRSPLTWPWRVTIAYVAFLLVLPITALLGRVGSLDPADFWRIVTSPVALSAYDVSFVTAIAAALLDGVFGTLVAWVLVRYEFPGKRIVDAAVDLPFALPTAVAGLTLATVYSDRGWIGQWLAPLGIQISFTRLGVAVAMLFISLPFVVRTVEPVLAEIDRDLEEAAWCLGASRSQTFWRVLLPQIFPAIVTGVALGFSRAVGEFGSVVIVSANLPFQDLIAPVLIFQRLEQYDFEGAAAIGAVMLFISLTMLLAINLLQAWGRRYDRA